jgi:hypothetical protein
LPDSAPDTPSTQRPPQSSQNTQIAHAGYQTVSRRVHAGMHIALFEDSTFSRHAAQLWNALTRQVHCLKLGPPRLDRWRACCVAVLRLQSWILYTEDQGLSVRTRGSAPSTNRQSPRFRTRFLGLRLTKAAGRHESHESSPRFRNPPPRRDTVRPIACLQFPFFFPDAEIRSSFRHGMLDVLDVLDVPFGHRGIGRQCHHGGADLSP